MTQLPDCTKRPNVTLVPTVYLRQLNRDTGTPCRVLQQWWSYSGGDETEPGVTGEWRDVPLVYE